MNKTVFWSWQSDLPPDTTKDFIKGALIQALENVAEELDLESADRLELDHDTKGEAGLVEIVTTIFKKIDACEVFVADITPVAEVITEAATKKVPNPNVMIELGYALREVGHQRVITVANLAFGGKPEELPFDLRHRRGAITYRLDSANNSSRDKVRKDLVKQLASALKMNLAVPREDQLIRNPMPLLSIENSEEMSGILEIRQSAQLDEIASLAEIMTKTPIKTQADQQAPISPFEAISSGPVDIFHHRRAKPFRAWTKEELEGYNQRVRWYYENYKKYLEKVTEHKLLLQRAVVIQLVLVNRGVRPALDVRATIKFPEGIRVYENDDLPEMPSAPQPPDLSPNQISHTIVQLQQSHAGLFKKTTRISDDRAELIFRAEKIQQGFHIPIRTFTAIIANKEDIHSFKAVYQVGADELPRQTTGELHFEIKQVGE